MNSTRISVCMFDNEIVRGGAEEHLLCLLRGLDRTRFRLLLVCPEELLALLARDMPGDVELFPLSLQKYSQLSRLQSLYRLLRKQQVDILHSHGFRPSLIASPVGRCAGVRANVETPHVREYWRKGWKSSYAIDRFAGRFVDRYIAVSEANKRYLVDEKRLPASKVTVVRNGCDIIRFDPARRAPLGLREKLGFAAQDPVLLIAGRLEPQKGHAVLLNAMALLKGEFPALRLIALGEGSLRSQLEQRVRELGMGDSVRMPGHVTDTRDWMAAADVCVLPSFSEGLPLFAIECLAAGRPIVASAVDGTPEVVRDGETGLTVPPGNPVLLADAIAKLLRDRRYAEALGAEGARWVRRCFTLERQICETGQIYEELCEQEIGARARAEEFVS